MRTKRKEPAANKALSRERAGRICRLLRFLGSGSKTRSQILRRLRVDIRTFYRDLELLRQCGIRIGLERRRYMLASTVDQAIACLPMPDIGLTIGEALALAKGRTKVHQRLKKELKQITG